MFKVEITLKELVKDYDWAQVFADENAGNVSKTIRVVPPGSSISDAPFGREDVAYIIAAVNGANDESDWLGVFRLKDGRYAVCSGGCDYTGWDCHAGNYMLVAENFPDVLQFGLSDPEAERLGITIASDAQSRKDPPCPN